MPKIEPTPDPLHPLSDIQTGPDALELVRAQREVRAILLGGALGDALGWPVEFLNREEIIDTFGVSGIESPPNPALTTDDTEMTVALGRALVEAGEKPLESLMESVSAAYIRWLDSHNPKRSPGLTCLAGARALKSGVSWRAAGVPEGAGCGATMRVAPVGFLYQHDEARLIEVAASSAQATHGAPSAIASAVGAALAVKLALDGFEPRVIADQVIESIQGVSPQLDRAIDRYFAARRIGSNEEAVTSIGSGWDGHEALFMALMCVERCPQSFIDAVRLAANIDGDSDSVASIVGNIQGARLGIDALPAQWVDNLEGRAELEALALDLGAKKLQLRRPGASSSE